MVCAECKENKPDTRHIDLLGEDLCSSCIHKIFNDNAKAQLDAHGRKPKRLSRMSKRGRRR